MPTRRFLAEGHLIDSGLLTRMLNIIVDAMLNSIATGNMIPAWARTICVDINPAVVTKLSDRGSGQTIGIVTEEKLQR